MKTIQPYLLIVACVLAADVRQPVVCAVSRKMRIKCTKEGSNGRVGGAEGVPVEKKEKMSVLIRFLIDSIFSEVNINRRTMHVNCHWKINAKKTMAAQAAYSVVPGGNISECV